VVDIVLGSWLQEGCSRNHQCSSDPGLKTFERSNQNVDSAALYWSERVTMPVQVQGMGGFCLEAGGGEKEIKKL
jgi:hypothetical protein